MDVSDAWVAAGCDPADPRLAQERALLVRSYAALLAAVHAEPPDGVGRDPAAVRTAHALDCRAWNIDNLGRSGLRVSALSLGTMTFGGRGNFANVGDTDITGAARQIDMALDAGIDLIDTADVYSDGLSEEIIGEVLDRSGRRDRILIATKARMPMGERANDAGLSRHHLIAACEASLRRLHADHIDLYQVHEWDGVTPLEETPERARRPRARRARCATSAARTTAAGSS